MSTSYLQPHVYGLGGMGAETSNLTMQAAAFVTANRASLEALLRSPGIRVEWHSMRVVSSSLLTANRWTYTLRKAQPATTPTSTVDVAETELTAVTAYNLAEYGNTASVAGGGVNATRANAAGFTLLAVPDEAFVHAYLIYTAAGVSVALFERMNQWDGECVSSLIDIIDGGTY